MCHSNCYNCDLPLDENRCTECDPDGDLFLTTSPGTCVADCPEGYTEALSGKICVTCH